MSPQDGGRVSAGGGAPPQDLPAQARLNYPQLFLVSFVMLFLELALVRLLSTEIRIFAYVNNLVLLACFLGVGLGCYYASARARLEVTIGGVALLLLLSSHQVFRDAPLMLSALTDHMIWYPRKPQDFAPEVAAGLVSTLLVFLCILLTFVPLGQRLGALLNAAVAQRPSRGEDPDGSAVGGIGEQGQPGGQHIAPRGPELPERKAPPAGLHRRRDLVVAYSVNILASLAGIWAFNVLAFVYAPPWVWLVVAGIALLPLLQRNARTIGLVLALAGLLFLLGMPSRGGSRLVVWSPYQRLELQEARGAPPTIKYRLLVNGVTYMWLLDLSDAALSQLPGGGAAERQARPLSAYDVPYRFRPGAKRVLIVGAGSGNDVAAALRSGAGQVTAVEIDPGIYRLAKWVHPEAPYRDPRVEMVIDDARSYFKKAAGRYDVVCFGLLDSHTLGSALTNARIDHYVYTEESFREAKALLAPGGVLVVTFEIPRVWVRDRLAGLLRKVFDADPLVFDNHTDPVFGLGGVHFVISEDMDALRRTVSNDPALQEFLAKQRLATSPPAARLPTDDWPYLYLEHARVPALHLLLSAILLLLFLAAKPAVVPSGRRIQWHFFLLGAAFLLLEFQNISKMSLCFGSTWFVSSLTLTAILALILLANLVVLRWPGLDVRFVYAGLGLSLALALAVPLDALNGLPYGWRALCVSGLLNLPIGFAGIIFIHSLNRSDSPETAFGSNLLGAGLGGILESVSFVTGIHWLLILVAGLYFGAWLTRHTLDRPAIVTGS